MTNGVCTFLKRLLGIACLFAACGTPTNALRKVAADDLQCADAELQLLKITRTDWDVTGCEKRATYALVGEPGNRRWQLRAPVERSASQPYRASPPPPRPRPPVGLESESEGVMVLGVDVFIPSNGIVLEWRGKPEPEPLLVHLTLRRKAPPFKLEGCEFKLVANGRLLELPEGSFEKTAFKESLSFVVPFASLVELAQSIRVVGQSCMGRFVLTEADLDGLRKFAIRYQEELALRGDPKKETVSPSGDSI
ncbi:MAG: hypothetical protein SF187_30005 [Deltaproteobacteria bacterium]|nr:hypothetical protein [Deltaproteobacteria bacterium]